MNLSPILCLLLLLPTLGVGGEGAIDESTPARAIASLIDPKKLATLKGERSSNPRLQKCLYWIEVDQRAEYPMKLSPSPLIVRALELNGINEETPYGEVIRDSLVECYLVAFNCGLFTTEGMSELRQGKSATITKGEYAGQEATADHFIPRSVCPELDNQIFNLRLLPSKQNSLKGDKVEWKQVAFAEYLNKGGLLSAEGLEAVRSAYKKDIVPPPTPPTLTQEERDKAEKENQTRMDEESRQMDLEAVRAERKGTEAVYEVWVRRLKKLGEQANKSKASSNILAFEKTLNSAMEIWERVFEENWNKNHPRQYKDDDILKKRAYEMQRNQEVAHLESFLEESLRAK